MNIYDFDTSANQIYAEQPYLFGQENAVLSSGFHINGSNRSDIFLGAENFPNEENTVLTYNPSCMYGSCERLDWRRQGLGQENTGHLEMLYHNHDNINPIFDPFNVENIPQYFNDYGKSLSNSIAVKPKFLCYNF